jgi:hypothetical protein
MARRKHRESEHADPVAEIAGKLVRGAGAPVKGLKGRPTREPGYTVEREVIYPRELSLRPMLADPYRLDDV